MKRAYYFEYDIDFGGIAVIAESAKQVKKLLWDNFDVREWCEGEWINLNPCWIKNADIDGLELGEVGIEGLKCGIYSSCGDATCPLCKYEYATLEYHSDWDVVCCSDCEEKLYQEWKNKQEVK